MQRGIIKPTQHAWLDYAVAATFLTMAVRFRHRNPAASTLAAVNGAMVLGMSALTDYPGGLIPAISFKTHGVLDVFQAALAGFGPRWFGFADREEARFFRAQAASEVGVISATDWSSPRAPGRAALA